METSKLTKYLTSITIFHYHLIGWRNMQIDTIGRPSDPSLGVKTQDIRRKVNTES